MWVGFIAILVTIKWGSEWRERANEKNGNTYKEADEIAVPKPSGTFEEGKVGSEQKKLKQKEVSSSSPVLVERHETAESDLGRDEVGEMVQHLRRMRTQRGQLPDSSMLLSRSHSLTEGHH